MLWQREKPECAVTAVCNHQWVTHPLLPTIEVRLAGEAPLSFKENVRKAIPL